MIPARSYAASMKRCSSAVVGKSRRTAQCCSSRAKRATWRISACCSRFAARSSDCRSRILRRSSSSLCRATSYLDRAERSLASISAVSPVAIGLWHRLRRFSAPPLGTKISPPLRKYAHTAAAACGTPGAGVVEAKSGASDARSHLPWAPAASRRCPRGDALRSQGAGGVRPCHGDLLHPITREAFGQDDLRRIEQASGRRIDPAELKERYKVLQEAASLRTALEADVLRILDVLLREMGEDESCTVVYRRLVQHFPVLTGAVTRLHEVDAEAAHFVLRRSQTVVRRARPKRRRVATWMLVRDYVDDLARILPRHDPVVIW